jgi:general secretion pathway protein A
LAEEEVTQYIHHRLKIAGVSDLNLFNPEAIRAVFEFSKGIPRLINLLCDTSLVYGFADEKKKIGREVVEEAVQARKADGLFCEVIESEKPDTAVIQVGDEALAALQNRIDRLEAKFTALEKTLNAGFETQTIILELMKMLKASMKSRDHMIVKYRQLRARLEQLEKHPPYPRLLKK